MRARLAGDGLWPTLSKDFHLMPWDVGRLTAREVADYEASARALVAARTSK